MRTSELPGVYDEDLRRDLVEGLDGIVEQEHYYRSLHGRFAKDWESLGISPTLVVSRHFEIHIVEADADRLLISALAEVDGKLADMASIDHRFELQANFPLPEPSVDHLRAVAFRHLAELRHAPEGIVPIESAVYRGYFNYRVSGASEGGRISVAIGIRQPVLGLQLDLAHPTGINGQRSFTDEVAPQPNREHLGERVAAALPGVVPEVVSEEWSKFAQNWRDLSKDTVLTPAARRPASVGAEDLDQKPLLFESLDAALGAAESRSVLPSKPPRE